ncbi:hypothetical protein DKX38_029071 [Salix brachista]|uniref:Uncharacterized protein n=1 Tax=Salix brachista TaxID=2182728 RepID=A0A5N5J414_9ROSI|nr:hypothetical protein DKX38_029071 [Salix brachista]
MLNSEPSEPVTSDEHGNSMPVGSSDKKVLEQQMDVDSENVNSALAMDTSLINDVPSDEGQMKLVQEIMDGLASVEGESIQERAGGFDKADVIQVSNGRDDKVNQMKDEGKLPVIDVDLTDSE